MRITIAHKKSKAQAIQAVDRAIEEVFRGLPMGPMTIIDQKKTWTGSTMTFSLIAKMGFLKNPISGTVEVTDQDVTIDADLGMLNKVLPQEKVHASVESRIRGLLA
ncbi:MAG: putative polyhydroxyalkanoic acid system protein gran rgn [Bryobacterales bacterium]|nr:putative polyhydroxyalkanoic acid system protein gran rgn [Bryobacterales bacterium]